MIIPEVSATGAAPPFKSKSESNAHYASENSTFFQNLPSLLKKTVNQVQKCTMLKYHKVMYKISMNENTLAVD